MNMRIDLTNSVPTNSGASTPISGAESKPFAGTSPSELPSGDTASLSMSSGLVAKAMNLPEIRMDKVEAIKAQIAAGTYEINPSKIADAIINSALSDEI